jgi:hypothetical protein
MTAQFYNNQQAIQEEQQGMPCVEFSAMAFGSFESQDASVSTSSTTSSSLSGWGSAVSRKSYACLKTLGEVEASKIHRPLRRIPNQSKSLVDVGQGWGYFVDTPDE